MTYEQSPLLPGCEVPRRHKPTRQTSREVYKVARAEFQGRKADTLRYLSGYWNRWQQSPTSAELTMRAPVFWSSYDYGVLYIRRGLSDLKAAGLVEPVPNGKRNCAITGHVCETWRVREIGSAEPR